MKGNSWKLAFKFLPEIWMMIRGGIPKIVLLAEFAGDREEDVEQQAYVALKTVTGKYHIPGHIAHNFDEAQKYWTIRRESYNLLRQHNARKISAPFIEDIVVHPDQLPEFMPQLDAIFAKYPAFVYTIAGHAGDANFHIMPLMDLSDKDQRDVIFKLSDEVFNLVMRFQGSITAEHNDGLVRGPFLKKMFGEQIFGLFRQTKQLFDPQNIFNPHKKTEAEIPFFTEHIKHGV
jgi:FAD/FMN-containing dehydrogenase